MAAGVESQHSRLTSESYQDVMNDDDDDELFPQNPLTFKPYNVFDTGKAFLFKYFETPRVSGTYTLNPHP